jgi:hypothetical protein
MTHLVEICLHKSTNLHASINTEAHGPLPLAGAGASTLLHIVESNGTYPHDTKLLRGSASSEYQPKRPRDTP